MRYAVPLFTLFILQSSAQAVGLLVPTDAKITPLAMVHHRVNVSIEDQVAITTVEQTFRNHTDRNLEATYLFPVPRGASVDRFTMWVNGTETSGELLDAKKAAQVYTDIVRRTQDPGLLEYLGNDLMRLRVFPVPPRGDQKMKISFKSIAKKDANVVEYIYPLKTDGKQTRTLEEFSVKISLNSSTPLQNIYSPTHAITVNKKNDKEATIDFARDQAMLDKDFQLFYGSGLGDIGLTPLLYKPITGEDGYVMLLVSPQLEAAKVRMPRDLIMVLDTSSSMSEEKMRQAKKAVKYCLTQLGPKDRFNIVKFSTSVSRFRDGLVEANTDYLERANKWVDDLRTSGGTAIWPALDESLSMRPNDPSRPFTMVFFTDGQPTVDETNPDKIVKNVSAKNSGNTRIFTFGVGDDVNANMLDQLAEATRAVSTYVRPAEDIETKVASLYGKISHPVMTDLRLATNDNVRLHEMYPGKLPDLFQGTQLVLLARYSGSGHTAIKLSGNVGGERKEFVYELNFPAKTETENGKDFVEPLWARRKVGYLLDQIRANGEQKELIDEVTAIAKKYGIATPYTSHLVVPDGPMPVVPPTRPIGRPVPHFNSPLPMGPVGGAVGLPPGLVPPGGTSGGATRRVEEFARDQSKGDGKPGDALVANRGFQFERDLKEAEKKLGLESDPVKRARLAKEVRDYRDKKQLQDEANLAFKGEKDRYQSGKLGVDLAQNSCNLREQSRISLTANRTANGRQVLEVGGVWIDDSFKPDMKAVVVKSQSDAYFKILEKHAAMKDVYRLGNHVVWIAPSGTALVLDQANGQESLTEAEIDALFAKK